jgi:hypothetical protein
MPSEAKNSGMLAALKRNPARTNWGETGGIPRVKDKEIRVRIGNSSDGGRTPAAGQQTVCYLGSIENEGLVLAPRDRYRYELANGEFRRSGFLPGVNQEATSEIGLFRTPRWIRLPR